MTKEDRHVPHWVAVLALVGACLLWGTSFASTKICGDILLAGTKPGTSIGFAMILFTAVRFTIAAPLILIFFRSARTWRIQRDEIAPLLKVAIPSAIGFILQAIGLGFTTATISGFITGLVVCFTPAAEWLLLKKRPTWRLAIGVLLALTGVALMTLTDTGSFTFGLGELFNLMAVFAFTLQIIYTGQSAKKIGPSRLAFGTFSIMAIIAWIVVVLISPGSVSGSLRGAFASGPFWFYFMLTMGCATIGAMMLMNTFQQYVRPSEAAIVYTSEPVFAMLFAIVFIGAGELPGTLGLVGAALMLAANLLVATKKKDSRGVPAGQL